MLEKIVEKHYARMVKEGWLNAFLASLVIGFSVLLATAAAFWLLGSDRPWIALIVAGVTIAASTPLLYFKKFRPTKKQIAKRVDELGLEERLLTMTELEEDDSYIAKRQREDTKKALAFFESKKLKIVASIPLIIAACVLLPCSFGMTAVAIASANGRIASGREIIDEITEPKPVDYEVEFVEEGGGIIEGDMLQIIEEGGLIDPVFAVPDEEWYFVEWSWEINGETYTLEETDEFFVEGLKVQQDMKITAVFAEMGEAGEGEGGEGGDGEPQEGEQEADSDEGEPQEGEGEQQESEDKDGEEGEESDENQDGESNPDEPGDGSGGMPQFRDQVIDGETDYGGEVYDEAVEDAEEELSSNDEIPEDWKDIIGDYFDNIKK